MEHYNNVKNTGHGGKDEEHYMFEAIMQLLSRPDQPVWEAYNKFTR
jgi:hypothetical protein